MKRILLIGLILSLSNVSWGQRKSKSTATNSYRFTYDLGASIGNYNNSSYQEITLGLNWYLREYMIWRNAVFARFGSNVESAQGLDTSVRFIFDTDYFAVFAGPGYRFANASNSALFGEAGAIIRVAGFSLGGGIKSLYYANPGKDSRGVDLPKNDNIIFIILAGGGAF